MRAGQKMIQRQENFSAAHKNLWAKFLYTAECFIYFLIFLFWVTCGDTPVSAQGTIWDTRNHTRVNLNQGNTLLTVLSLQPLYIYVLKYKDNSNSLSKKKKHQV